MMVFSMLIVGFAEAFQGLVLKMKAMIVGGSIGTLMGIILLCAICAGVMLYAYWVMPMLIIAFICMMVIPGHILNANSKKEK